MQQYPFIFSEERKWKIRRHLSFWITWTVFNGFLYSFVQIRFEASYGQRLLMSSMSSAVYMIPHIFLAYSLMYWVIPRFVISQQYWKAAGWAIIASVISAGMAMLLSITAIIWICLLFAPPGIYNTPAMSLNTMFLGLMAGFRGALSIAGIAATIKLVKYWYIKEQRNLQLQKENAESQLQLLKAQVHPHFLFNTLNNIYSYSQTGSPLAPQMITGLSGILRFMLYESSQSLVPLERELGILNDYIELEKIRYGTDFDLQVRFPEDTNDLWIAPLLLLPLVENAFKHGSSNMIEQPWISLEITVDENRMLMKLLNGKPVRVRRSEASGIGIRNVSERLSLLYPTKHELDIRDEEDVYIVNLRVELTMMATIKQRQLKTEVVYE